MRSPVAWMQSKRREQKVRRYERTAQKSRPILKATPMQVPVRNVPPRVYGGTPKASIKSVRRAKAKQAKWSRKRNRVHR